MTYCFVENSQYDVTPQLYNAEEIPHYICNQ